MLLSIFKQNLSLILPVQIRPISTAKSQLVSFVNFVISEALVAVQSAPAPLTRKDSFLGMETEAPKPLKTVSEVPLSMLE